MILPSKELVSAVLDLEVFDIHPEKYPKQHGNVVYFKTNSRGIIGEEDFHNIYELAHKCKAWALEQGYHLLSATIKPESTCDIHSIKKGTLLCEKEPIASVLADTELESIFKACEYILTTLNIKDKQ